MSERYKKGNIVMNTMQRIVYAPGHTYSSWLAWALQAFDFLGVPTQVDKALVANKGITQGHVWTHANDNPLGLPIYAFGYMHPIVTYQLTITLKHESAGDITVTIDVDHETYGMAAVGETISVKYAINTAAGSIFIGAV